MAGIRLVRMTRRALMAGVASVLAVPAMAGDLPATSKGAETLASVFKTYYGATPTVTPQGAAYLVSFDFAPPSTLFGARDFKFDPMKIAMKMYAQDDGAWRYEIMGMPPIVVHGSVDNSEISETITFANIKQVGVYDPAIASFRSVEASGDKIAIAATFANGDENVEINGFKASGTSAAASGDTVAGTVKESADSFGMKVHAEPKAKQGAAKDPIAINFKGGAASGEFKFDGVRSKALVALWGFVVAHPQRADLAASEAAFKTLLTAAILGTPSASSTFQIDKIAFDTSRGASGSADKASGGVSGAMNGPQSQFEEHFAFSGISLPESVVPAAYRPIVPTSLDIGFKVSGFDATAAVQEAIADIKLAGDGPWLGKDEHEKIAAKLVGTGVINIDIPTSHIVGPQLDVTMDGHAQYRNGEKPVGKITFRLRNFDKTVAALQGLGQDVQQKVVPMIAMVKGLAKADGDAMVWVCEIGADRVMKVNGLPLGKAPI